MTSPRKYTQKTIDEMKALRDSGLTYEAIGKKYKITRGTVYKLLHRWADMYKPAEEIPSLSTYVTLREYCIIHNMTYSNLYYHIKKHNIATKIYHNKLYIRIDTKIKNHKFLSEEAIDKIVEAAKEGLSIRQIAKQLGVNRATVKEYKDD